MQTIESSTFLIVSKDRLESRLAKHPEIAIKLIKGLAQRRRVTTDNVKSLALMDVYGRIGNRRVAAV